MTRQLIRKDVFGLVAFEWNKHTQKELYLSDEQAADLDAGRIVHTPTRGGTDFYLLKDGPGAVTEPQVDCPMCGGSGHVDRNRIYGAVVTNKKRGKIA